MLAGAGPRTVQVAGSFLDKPAFAQVLAPLLGVRPISPTARPVFRPGEPCEEQETPDLNAADGVPDPK